VFATVVIVTIKDLDAASQQLESDVVPMVKSQPGFVSGHWLAPKDGKGMSITIWESEANANAAADMIRAIPDEAPVRLDSVEVRAVGVSA
jgi:hypothetical protein